MADITVVGTGVAGSAIAREAAKRGVSVRLVGGRPQASLAALSILRAAYLKDEADATSALAYAVEAYQAAGCEVVAGAFVSSVAHPEEKQQNDWWAVEPAPYLMPGEERKVPPTWVDPSSKFTIHCTGAEGVEGEVTFGVTWLNYDPKALTRIDLRVYHFAPYKSIDAVSFKSGCRLGSSSAKTVESARTEAVKMFEIANERGWVKVQPGWVAIVGRRVKAKELVVDHGGGRFSFGGFHRTGWSLAPLRASQLLGKLGF